MPAEFEKMRKEIKKGILKDNPNMSDEDAEKRSYAIATTQWKKSHSGKGPSESAIIKFNYSIPIEEFATVESDFIIAGTAINATITSNNHKFLPEVLQESAKTLMGVPLLIDHKNEVEAIKGRVFYAEYDDINQKIPFKAKVMDSTIKMMIKDGRLNSVSVGASVDPKNIKEDKDGTLIPTNITFKELSLVAVPADQGATFGIAMKEAYKLFKENDTEDDIENDIENATEEKMNDQNHKIIERRENMSEQKAEIVEEKIEVKTEIKEITEDAKLDEEIKNLKLALKKQEIETLKEKLKKTEIKKEEKAEIEEEEPISGYKLIQGVGSLKGGSVTMIKNNYKSRLPI